MRALSRLAMLTVAVTILGTRAVAASSIVVAEFRWDTLLVDDSTGCSLADPACVLSVFTLTNLWDGDAPAPTLIDGQLTLPADTLRFFDVPPDLPFNFDRLVQPGIPAFAAVSLSFLFEGGTLSLGATLPGPNTFEVLRFDPATVPEPGTLGLLAVGMAAFARYSRRGGARR